jgi:hypothetical protein
MAAPQNGQMSALELSALAGVTPEQLAIIARAMQSGALPLPPLAQPAYLPIKPAQPNTTKRPEVNSISAAGDTDREEGELADEEEEHEHSLEHESARAPPTGPRNKSRPPRGKAMQADAAGQKVTDMPKSSSMQYVRQIADLRDKSLPRAGTGKHGATSNHMTSIDRTQRYAPGPHHRDVSKSARRQKLSEFLHVMFSAGFSQEQLASQVSNPNAFRQMTVALGLHPHASAPDSKPFSPIRGSIDSVRSPEKNVAILPKPVKKSGPVKPTGLDRSAYLAKLQAAKNKKADAVSKPATDKTTTAPKALDATGLSQSFEKAAVTPLKLSSSAKAAKDELLRQRLEAIRAAKVTNVPASLPRKIGPSTYSAPQPMDEHARSVVSAIKNISRAAEYNTLMQEPLPDNVAVPAFGRAAIPMTKSPTTKSAPHTTASVSNVAAVGSNTSTVRSSFSGLPGLFLTSTQQLPKSSQSDVILSSHATSNTPLPEGQFVSGSPAKVPSRNGAGSSVQFPSHSIAAPSVLFGGRDPLDEPMIITVSDDEDDDDVMDISSSDREQSSSELNRDTKSNVAVLHVNPARPGLHRSNTSSSAVTTAPTTPKTDAYNKKIQELEVLKRRLAEIELRKQAKIIGKPDGGVVTSAPPVQDHTPPVEPTLPLLATRSPLVGVATTMDPDAENGPAMQEPAPLPNLDNDATMDEEEQTDDDDDDAMDMSDDATTVSSESVNDEYEPELEFDPPAGLHVQPKVQQSQDDIEASPFADNAVSAGDNIASSTTDAADHQLATHQRSVERQDVSLPSLHDCLSY